MSPFDPFRGGGVAKRGQCPLFLPFFFQESVPNVKVTKADGNTGGGPDLTPSADQEKNWAMSLGCTMCNVMKEEAVTEFLRRVGWCVDFKPTPGFLGQSTNDANYNLCSSFSGSIITLTSDGTPCHNFATNNWFEKDLFS